MAVLVQKFGGTSVSDLSHIQHIAKHIAHTQREGHQVVVVVSAMAGETDRLVGLSQGITRQPRHREYDALVSAGEQISSALLAMMLIEQGIEARSYAGHQIPIVTDSRHKKARILRIETDKLRKDLDQGVIPIIAGFQGVDAQGNVTTLGRGGSDITAVAIAAAMSADECHMLTDVGGVYTADPRLVDSAKRLDYLTYEEMLELSSLGSQILQIRSVEFAQKYGVPLRVMSSFKPDSGTLISRQETHMEQAVVSGIAFDRHQALITIQAVPLGADFIAKLLSKMSDAGIDVDLLVQSSPDAQSLINFSFTVHRDDFNKAFALSKATAQQCNAGEVVGNERVAKIALVGVGMRSHAGVAATLFQCLSQQQVAIQLIATSEIKISAVIGDESGVKAIQALHSAFNLDITNTALT